MLCSLCKQKPATTYIKQTINGQTSEFHVCGDCAAKQGYGYFYETPFHIADLFGGFFAEPFLREGEQPLRCDTCQSSFREIAKNGKVGCSDCYTTFFEQLQPSIQRIHGKTVHVGKMAASASRDAKKAHKLEQLKNELTTAVSQQQFERCAELRDRIKELEGENHEQ